MSTNRFIQQDVIRGSGYDEREFGWLWLIPLATYGVGDIVTTITLLRFTAAVNELNGLITVVVDTFGLSGFVALKLGVFLACLGISLLGATWDDPVLYYFPPIVLSVVGTFVTAMNLQLFFL